MAAIPSEAETGAGRVAEDYLKAIWSASEWGAGPATVSSLARRFATSKATVSINLKRLVSQGLVVHEPYGAIELTETGDALAIAMVRSHRVLETFLVETLGYRWDEIHDLAERLEHSATNELIDRIHAMLGKPAFDPHGDPIPDADGAVHYREGAIRLSEAGRGSFEIVRISDASPELLRTLAGSGIVVGSVIAVEAEDVAGASDSEAARATVRIGDSRLALSGDELEQLIGIRLGEPAAPLNLGS